MGCASSSSVKESPLHQPIEKQYEPFQPTTDPYNYAGGDIIQNNLIIKNGDLPPPLPPTTTKQQIIGENGGGNTVAAENTKYTAPASDRSITDFTKNVLLPPSTTEVERNVAFVETTPPTGGKVESAPSSVHENPAAAPLPMSQNAYSNESPTGHKNPDNLTPVPETDKKTKVKLFPAANSNVVQEQVQMHMQQLREQQKIAEEMRNSDKKRQQQTLKEKLKQRTVLKKQRLATGVTSTDVDVTQETQAAGDVIGVTDGTTLRDLTLDPVAADQAPQPSMPATKKEALYSEENISLFRDLESHAVNMDKVTSAAVTFAILMDDLLISQLSDLEKVRILFHWITAQDLNAINFPTNIQEDTPLGYLLAIKEDRKTYASLFLRLCGAASLHAKLITGFLKGVGYYPDYKFKPSGDPFRGSWNAVLVDGQWRLIDTNWGARHVTEEEEVSSGNWKTEYKYEEHYFLTDPDLMINTHFPDEQDWQLLPQPYSLEQFEKTTKLWPLFYKLKLGLSSHPHGVITADNHGYVRIEINVSPFARADGRFKAELRMRDKRMAQSGVNLLQYIFHYTEDDKEVCEIYLPSTGEYILKMFGLSSKYSEKDMYTNICLYQINCPDIKSPPSNTKVLPPFPVINTFFGPDLASSQLVARPVTHRGPIVECDASGEAKVVMLVTASDRNISFTQDLHCGAGPSDARVGNVVHSVSEKQGSMEIVFMLRTPRNGNYALTLYSNVADTSSGTFTPFCHYLVVSRNQHHGNEAISFPQIPNGRVGRIQPHFGELGLKVASCFPDTNGHCENGILRTDSSGECCVTFSHPYALTVIVDFTCENAPVSLNEYTMVSTTGSFTTITIHTPVQICANAVFALKVYAAKLFQTQNIPSVFIAHVFPEARNPEVPSLPQSPTRCWGPAGLKFYNSGLEAITFKNSTSTSENQGNLPNEAKITSPCRVYNGGDDFEMVLQTKNPLQLKTKLVPLDKQANNPSITYDDFVFLGQADMNSASVRIRFVHPGTFSLVVYGSDMDDASGQLPPLIYVLIRVSSASKCIQPFPTSFGIWMSSARMLHCPIADAIQRNKQTLIKLYLGRFEKGGGSDWSVVPYTDVVLVIDGATPVHPTKSLSCMYEWDYVAGPAEKVVGILVKPTSDAQSMTYALQFKVV